MNPTCTLLFILFHLSSSLLHTPEKPRLPPSEVDLDRIYLEIFQNWRAQGFSETKTFYFDHQHRKRLLVPRPEPSPELGDSEAPSLVPGAVLSVSFELTNYVKDQIVGLLHEQFKDFTLPTQVEAPNLVFSKMNVKLPTLLPENVDMYLDEAQNCAVLILTDIQVQLHSDVTVQKYLIFDKKGRLRVDADIPYLKVKLHFVDEPGTLLKTPKVLLKLVNLRIPADRLAIDLSLDYIPSFITDTVLFFVKGYLIQQISLFAHDYLPNDGTRQVNEIIRAGFPGELPLYRDSLVMSIFLTKMIRVQGNRLVIEVDGHTFDKETGRGVRPGPSRVASASRRKTPRAWSWAFPRKSSSTCW